MKSFVAACFVLIFVSGLVIYKAYGPQKCHWRRAAFDIGSGSTKLKVADVDICKKKILKIIYQASAKADFKTDIEKHGFFTASTLERGISALRALKDQTKNLEPQPEAFSAVATAAFRDSRNAHAFVKAVRQSKHLQIPVFIIDQNHEARLGFFAALGHTKKNKEDILVWDIGSGSMQISAWQGHDLEVFQGQLASVSFKNYIIRELQNKDINKTYSPNPIGIKSLNKAVIYAATKAEQTVSPQIKTLAANKEVIGIGGVHYFSLRNQLKLKKNESYRVIDISPILKQRAQWSDKKVNNEYAETQVSNLALVKAFMQALKIKKVLPVNVNLADGLLLEEKLWPRKLFL